MLRTTAEGKAARDYLFAQLPAGTAVVIATYKDPGDKYGRWLAEVFDGNVSLNQLMISSGHAKPYAP